MGYFVFLFWCAGYRTTRGNTRWNTLYFYSGVQRIEIQVEIQDGVPRIEIQADNTMYFYSGVPGIEIQAEIQDGTLYIYILVCQE